MGSLKKIVILDIDDQRLLDNRVFDRNISFQISHTYEPICNLYREASRVGVEFITPDIYFRKASEIERSSKIFLLSILESKFTKKLLKDPKITPLMLLCQESPFIATQFYLRLKWISQHYRYSMVFSGMKNFLSKKTEFFSMYFPIAYPPQHIPSVTPFESRKLICYVASNKYQNNFFKKVCINFIYGFNINHLYKVRSNVLEGLSKNDSFDLYGFGWEKNIKYSHVYKGVIEDKYSVQSKYRFCLCLENSSFPGYITEKIFDAFISGSVPVYMGAPDVENFVDKDCFVDMRNFKNTEDLVFYLSSMDEKEYVKYLENIKRYLNSAVFYKFNQKYFIEKILSLVASCN